MQAYEKFMLLALEEAKKALVHGDVPVGAVIVKDSRVIACAKNERELNCDPTAHAEILAIRKAAENTGSWKLDGCTLYVTLEPCPMCAGAIAMSRMDAVVYGAFDKTMGCAGSLYELCGDRHFGPGVKIIGGILKNDCAALLSDFFKNKRK